MGLLGRLRSWLTGRGPAGAAEPPGPRDTRPADGRIDRARVLGCRVAPNPRNPNYGRFLGFEPDSRLPTAGPGAPRRRGRAGWPQPLLGRVVVLSLFIGRHGTSWSDREIAYAHRALERAAAWIEREAMRWHAAVNIEVAETYFVSDDDVVEDVVVEFAPRGGGPAGPYGGVARGEDVEIFDVNDIVKIVAGASRAAARLGFADVADLVAQVEARVEADACAWLLHLRSEGRSMAIPEEVTALDGVNLAACYAREADLPGPLDGPVFSDPITYVHELLHLFGAEDKYGVPLGRYDRRMLTDRDIMVLAHESLARLRVDPLTALEIGWPSEGPF